jgi:rhodanese-related sulfurtransferase
LFYQFGHVPGALSLPRADFESAYAALRARLEKNRRRPIVVYCSDRSCEDSSAVRTALAKLGYTDVAVFHGGWAAWSAAHRPEAKDRP